MENVKNKKFKEVMIMRIVYGLEEKYADGAIPIKEIISQAKDKGFKEMEVEEIIEKLKIEGLIFEFKRNFIKTV